jgi:hypothetical protein
MPVRVFKDIEFDKWARRHGPSDRLLCAAADEIERGLIDARLGGCLLKKRVASPGRGKRGSYRTILAHRQGERLVFLYGFAKNERDNITAQEKKALQRLGEEYMAYDDAKMSKLVATGLILEIGCHEQDPPQRP